MNETTKRILKLWYIIFLCIFFLFGGRIFGGWITKTTEIRIGEINLFWLIIILLVFLTMIIFRKELEPLVFPFGVKIRKKNKVNQPNRIT